MTPAERVARALHPRPRRTAGGWMVPCVAHNDRTPSLSVADGERVPLLVRCWAGCDARDILAELRRRGLLADRPADPDWRPRLPHRSAPVRPAPARRASDPRILRRIWAATRLITPDDPAGRYLAARGCAMPHPEGDLRWLPSYRHPKSAHSGPALIGRITDVHDAERMISVHQTWIAGDGSGRKAFDHLPREMRPKARLYPFGYPTVGGVIRLSPDCEVTHGLAVGEGVETCLALARCGLPVWSAMDASHLAPFPVLAGIDCLTIAVDHDAAGIKAAEELTARWLAAGREVRRIISAAPGEDAVDIAARVGRAA